MSLIKNILYLLILILVSLTAVSCDDLSLDLDDEGYEGNIVLHFRTPEVAVKGTIEDNECESYMSHLDVIIYEFKGSSYAPFHYERISVSATPQGTVSLHRTKEDFDEGVEYKFFVIANSTLKETAYYDGEELLSYDKFLKLDQTDRMIHLSGVDHETMNPNYPQKFLMDGVAYIGSSEPASPGCVVVNDSDSNDDVLLNVVLRRAAAKILITIIPGDNVTFTKELIAKSQGYLIRNMPNRTTLVAEGGYPVNDGGLTPYWESTTISQSPYFQMVKVKDKHEVERDGIQLTAYCYSHRWESNEVFERGTSVVMLLPLKYKETAESEEIEYINNYYQLSITPKRQINRNTIYDLRINLNAPGAEDITTPEDVKDIQYFTAPWEKEDLKISGESNVKFLKVNKKKIYMYNVADDNTSLYFSSSSPVTVRIYGYPCYFDKYNMQVTLQSNTAEYKSIKATTTEGSVSGNIAIHSDIPTNNTIRYFQLKVENEEGLYEIIDVEQYPLIYITNNLPWYSYRDDYYHRAGSHSWHGNTDKLTTDGDLPTTYRYAGDHIVSIYNINSVNTTTKEVSYTYSSSKPSNPYGFTTSKYRGDKVQGSQKYNIMYYNFSYSKSGKNYVWTMKTDSRCEQHNVRNYHIRMMASSPNYTVGRPALDKYGYTAGDADNAKLVSPSFVIASRLGAVLSTYSGLSGMSNEKKLVVFADHCKNYVEVDDVNDNKQNPVEVHDNWRLPTEAELKIIMDIQGGDGVDAPAIDFLLNGGYYMSASGPVFNPKNTSGVSEASDKWSVADVAIRCVRDAY